MSILNRKRDLIWLVFFAIHIPVMFCVDLVPIVYPASLKPGFLTTIRTFYIETYHDRFFTTPPAWFHMYLWMELLYHVPLSIWALGALLRDDAKVPIHLLMYAVQTGVTTATCIADYMSWNSFSDGEKLELGKLYVPYLAVSVLMGLDMYFRMVSVVENKQVTRTKKQS